MQRLMSFGVLILLMLLYTHGRYLSDTCRGSTGDLVFLLDSSDSVYEEDFAMQLQFVQQLASHLPIGRDGVHVSLAIFSSNVTLHFGLQDFLTREELISAIGTVKYTGGSTRTDLALKYATENILANSKRGRKNVPQMVIVITDGHSIDLNRTLIEASVARSFGIQIASVGVNTGPDDSKLRALCSQHGGLTLLFKAQDVLSLRSLVYDLTEVICKVLSAHATELSDDPGLHVSTMSQSEGEKSNDSGIGPNSTEETALFDKPDLQPCDAAYGINVLYVYDCQHTYKERSSSALNFITDMLYMTRKMPWNSEHFTQSCDNLELPSERRNKKVSRVSDTTKDSDLADLIRRARIRLFGQNFRHSKQKTSYQNRNVVVLFVDKYIDDETHPYQIRLEVKRLKFRAKVIVVYQNKPQAEWIKTLASEPFGLNAIVLSDWNILYRFRRSILERICQD